MPITKPLPTIGRRMEGTAAIASDGANERAEVSIIGIPSTSPSRNESTALVECITSRPAATCVAIRKSKTIPIIGFGMVSSTATASGKMANTTIATVTVLVFQCTSVWNELLFAMTMAGSWTTPATLALNQMVGSLSANFSTQMAGSIWLTLPVLVLYMFLGKYLIRGYMAGAVTAS